MGPRRQSLSWLCRRNGRGLGRMIRPRKKPRRGRVRDPKYLEWIRGFCCIVCWLAGTGEWEAFCAEPHDVYGKAVDQTSPTEAAHVGERGLGQKCSDRETIPLCAAHHRMGKD